MEPAEIQYPSKMEAILPTGKSGSCLFEDYNEAVESCVKAQTEWADSPLDLRVAIGKALRSAGEKFSKDFAWAAWSETGRGRYEDKIGKNMVCATKTPGAESLQPTIVTGSFGACITDLAPFGVIASITPTTNPTATVINNSISITAGGNGVVFQPHPAAAQCTCRAVCVMNEAIQSAGGPANLVVAVSKPTIEGAAALMSDSRTAANLITGGPAVVKRALQSGKRSFCAGPGNPPVIVDETADISAAAAGIVKGASFDNNMICSDEKEVFVVRSVADDLLKEFKKIGCIILTSEEIEKVKKLIFKGENIPNGEEGQVDSQLVGLNAGTLLEKIGRKGVGPEVRLAIAEVKPDDALILSEQLMPILPVARVENFDEALEYAKIAEHGYRHSAALWTKDIDRMSKAPHKIWASNFVFNGPLFCGLAVEGEGYTSFSVAGYTGEGYTRPSTFVRERRFCVKHALRFV